MVTCSNFPFQIEENTQTHKHPYPIHPHTHPHTHPSHIHTTLSPLPTHTHTHTNPHKTPRKKNIQLFRKRFTTSVFDHHHIPLHSWCSPENVTQDSLQPIIINIFKSSLLLLVKPKRPSSNFVKLINYSHLISLHHMTVSKKKKKKKIRSGIRDKNKNKTNCNFFFISDSWKQQV